jgi:hypothetical protein
VNLQDFIAATAPGVQVGTGIFQQAVHEDDEFAHDRHQSDFFSLRKLGLNTTKISAD